MRRRIGEVRQIEEERWRGSSRMRGGEEVEVGGVG